MSPWYIRESLETYPFAGGRGSESEHPAGRASGLALSSSCGEFGDIRWRIQCHNVWNQHIFDWSWFSFAVECLYHVISYDIMWYHVVTYYECCSIWKYAEVCWRVRKSARCADVPWVVLGLRCLVTGDTRHSTATHRIWESCRLCRPTGCA